MWAMITWVSILGCIKLIRLVKINITTIIIKKNQKKKYHFMKMKIALIKLQKNIKNLSFNIMIDQTDMIQKFVKEYIDIHFYFLLYQH